MNAIKKIKSVFATGLVLLLVSCNSCMGHKTKRIEWGRGEKGRKSLMFKRLCAI